MRVFGENQPMYISNVTLIQAVHCIYKHKNTLVSICLINLYKTNKNISKR